MPHGELLIRTHKATTGRNTDGYVDAFDRYGLSLEDGAMSQLLMPAPNKDAVGNSNAVTAGVAYSAATTNVADEQALSLEAHIYANNMSQFLTRLQLFTDEVLSLDRGEFIRIKTKYRPSRVYRVLYRNFQQFSTFNIEMAKFIWTLAEPHPELRNATPPDYRWAVVAVVETDSDLDKLIGIKGLLEDFDRAIVTNASDNNFYRIFREDGAADGGPCWEVDSEEVYEGDGVKNFIDGNYWQYDGSNWKKHWY